MFTAVNHQIGDSPHHSPRVEQAYWDVDQTWGFVIQLTSSRLTVHHLGRLPSKKLFKPFAIQAFLSQYES